MSMNPLPKIHTNIPKEELSWNELFYASLGESYWVLAVLILFAIIFFVRMFMGSLGGLGDILLMFIFSVGIIYIFIAIPTSIVYAFVMRNHYTKR